MNREQAQAEFDHLLRPYTFAPGCGDHTPTRPRRPARASPGPLGNELLTNYPGGGSSARRPAVLGPEIDRAYPGSRPAPRQPGIGNDVDRSYPDPVCPRRRDAYQLGQRTTSTGRDAAFYEWVCENVVRQIVLTAEQAAPRHGDRFVGVSSWMVQSYSETRTAEGIEITMRVSALVQGRQPAEVFNVVARRRGHDVQVTITRGSGLTSANGLDRTDAGITQVRTTSRMTAGAPTVVQPRPRPHGGPNPARPH